MSRATLTRSLGSTTDPTVLIPGDPVAMRADADRMDALAADLSRSAGAVAGTEFGGWNGQARDAYVAGKDALHARLSMAANSIPVAAGALRQYAAVLEAAQAEARVLARQWRTAAACAPVEPGVLSASSLAPEQLRAQARYDRLLGEVHAVATAVATTIEAATTDAPIVPTFWNQLGQRWSEFWSAPVQDIGNMLALWWSVSTIRGVIDPEGTMLSFGQLLLGLQTSLQDPRQFAKDIIDWDTWQTSPASALGSLAPDIALAFVTGGAGAAAIRGARGTAKAGLRAATAGAIRAGASAAWKNSTVVALDSARRSLGQSVSGFWNGRLLAVNWADDTGAIRIRAVQADATPMFVKPGYEPSGRWAHPDARQEWFDQLREGPDSGPEGSRTRRTIGSTEGWMQYQQRVIGPEEYRLHGGGERIWADGVHLDPDGVAAIDAKFTEGGPSALYEGKAPAFLTDKAMAQFDGEMERYAAVIRDAENPVARLRIITPTSAAADFLGERARRLLGQDVDLEVVIEP